MKNQFTSSRLPSSLCTNDSICPYDVNFKAEVAVDFIFLI